MREAKIIAATAFCVALLVGLLWWQGVLPPSDALDETEAEADLMPQAQGGEGLTNPAAAPQVTPLPAPAGEQINLPSGRGAVWVDSAQDALGPAGLTYRYRFVVPSLADGLTDKVLDELQQDMASLCNGWVLDRIARPGPLPAQIVITLMERQTVFGENDDEVVQLFEAYSLMPAEGAKPGARMDDPATPLACRWELY